MRLGSLHVIDEKLEVRNKLGYTDMLGHKMSLKELSCNGVG